MRACWLPIRVSVQLLQPLVSAGHAVAGERLLQALALCSYELQHGCSVKQRRCPSAGAIQQFLDQLLPPQTSTWLPLPARAASGSLLFYAEPSSAGGSPDVHCVTPAKFRVTAVETRVTAES